MITNDGYVSDFLKEKVKCRAEQMSETVTSQPGDVDSNKLYCKCHADCNKHYTVCPKKSEPLNILQQQPQICSDLNKILHTQDDICYKHYYLVSYKSALTLLKYEFLNNITHKS